MPSRLCSAVACGPPPWTMATRWPPATRRRTSPETASTSGLATTSPPSFTTSVFTIPPSRRPGPRVLERHGLGQPQHEVHVLDGLAGPALDEVVQGRDGGHGAPAAEGWPHHRAHLGVVRPGDRRHLGEAPRGHPNEWLGGIGVLVESPDALLGPVLGDLREAGGKDAAAERRRDRHEAQFQLAGPGLAQRLLDLRDVLVRER